MSPIYLPGHRPTLLVNVATTALPAPKIEFERSKSFSNFFSIYIYIYLSLLTGLEKNKYIYIYLVNKWTEMRRKKGIEAPRGVFQRIRRKRLKKSVVSTRRHRYSFPLCRGTVETINEAVDVGARAAAKRGRDVTGRNNRPRRDALSRLTSRSLSRRKGSATGEHPRLCLYESSF